MADAPARLDLIAQWGRLNEGIVALIDSIPDDKMDWSPRDDLWSFRRILGHLALSRSNWLSTRPERAAEREREMDQAMQTKDGIKEQLRRGWGRIERFFADQANLDRVYKGVLDGEQYSYSGHWIAFHLLEHDIHHRADIFHYLALLGVDHPAVETP